MTRLLSGGVLLAVWVILSLAFPPTIVPGPLQVAGTIADNVASGTAALHLSRTILRVVLGLALAMLIGSTLGISMGLSRKAETFFESWVTVGLTVPAIVYGMLCLLWFGLNDLGAVLAIAMTASPSIGINVWQGTRSIDTDLVAMGKAFRFGRADIVRKIVLPQLVPYLLAAVRFALGICWKICTTVELIGLSSGVGFMLHYWFGLFSMAQVFAWTLKFLIVMLVIEYLVFKPAEKKLLAWRPAIQV